MFTQLPWNLTEQLLMCRAWHLSFSRHIEIGFCFTLALPSVFITIPCLWHNLSTSTFLHSKSTKCSICQHSESKLVFSIPLVSWYLLTKTEFIRNVSLKMCSIYTFSMHFLIAKMFWIIICQSHFPLWKQKGQRVGKKEKKSDSSG